MKKSSNLKKVGKAFMYLFLLGIVISVFSGNDSAENKNTNVEATTINETEVSASKAVDTSAEVETPEEKHTELEDAKVQEADNISKKSENDDLSDEYKARLEEQEEETPEVESTTEAEKTQISGTTMQLSESKKEELIGYVKEYSGSDEVKVSFIPSSNPSSSSDGLVMVDYYLDVSPTKNELDSDLASIVILSQSVAKESGITNADVSVAAMLKDGTPLGVGNYYSSTGKTDIDTHSLGN